MSRDKIVEQHPSYGIIHIHRTQGGGRRRLFGSPITDHQHTVRIDICAAERIHDLGYDRYHGEVRPIMQVELSAAQYAEAITTMNGGGVPCTIRIRERAAVEPPPIDVKVEADLVREEFAKDVKAKAAALRPAIAEIEAVIAKKSLTNDDRAKVRAALSQFARLFYDSAPFMLEQFEEATQRITTTAKIEVDAFMTAAITAAGLKAISERGVEALPEGMRPALPAPEEG